MTIADYFEIIIPFDKIECIDNYQMTSRIRFGFSIPTLETS
jgi:hypothetical protein